MTPTSQVRVDAVFQDRQLLLIQARDVRLGELLISEFGQRLASPQPQRFTEETRRLLGCTCCQRRSSARRKVREAPHIHRLGIHVQQVTRGLGHHHARRQRPPQLRDQHLQRVGDARRGIVTPQLLHQSVGGHHLTRPHRQRRQQPPKLGTR
jgi:hypothetical protein